LPAIFFAADLLKPPDGAKVTRLFVQIKQIVATIAFINPLKPKTMSKTDELAKAYSGLLGDQVQPMARSGRYLYPATCAVTGTTGLVVEVSVKDIPGNRVKSSVTL